MSGPISQWQSRPGMLETFGHSALQGAGQSLGRQAGEGLGALAGMGASKLGNLMGSQDNSGVEFWISQGYSPTEAQFLASAPPQVQQQAMKQKSGQKRAEAVGAALGGIRGVPRGGQGAEGAPRQPQGEEEFDADLVEAAMAGASEQDLFNLVKAKQGQQKIGQQEEKVEIARHKTTAPVMKGYADEYKAAKKGLHTIERMKELDKEDLAGPGEARFLETVGEIPGIGKFIKAFTGPFALNPASQEFQKLQSEFLTEMRSLFGGNIPVAEMEQFMKGIPTLMNTKEGRRRIYKNLEYGYKIKKQAYKIGQEIKRENKGRTPLDIDDQVTARLGKRMKKIASKIDFSAPKVAEGAPAPVQSPRQQSSGGPKAPFVPYEHSMRNTLEDMF